MVIAVESLSKSSQEASTATDQVSRAADSLSEQAHLLQEAVAFFKLDDNGREVALTGKGRPMPLPEFV
ncbi:hypothetical protein D3C86_2252600 [compost metagenome]